MTHDSLIKGTKEYLMEVKELTLVCKKVVEEIDWYCMGCGKLFKGSIYGLYHGETGGLVTINITGQNENYLCKDCKKRINIEKG